MEENIKDINENIKEIKEQLTMAGMKNSRKLKVDSELFLIAEKVREIELLMLDLETFI